MITESMDQAGRCYMQARAAPNAAMKARLTRIGDCYLSCAEEQRRGRAIVQAVYPAPGPVLGWRAPNGMPATPV
jgi:hypothetical protein